MQINVEELFTINDMAKANGWSHRRADRFIQFMVKHKQFVKLKNYNNKRSKYIYYAK